MFTILIALVLLLLSPLAGGFITGVDRRLTAWLQSRYGPPLVQPFYDVLKLLGKAPMIVNSWQVLCAYIYLVSAVVALFIFFMQGDLLLIFFVVTVGAVAQVVGAMTVNSPFGQTGAQRELLQMLAYEPLLVMVFVGMAKAAGSFNVSDIMNVEEPLLFSLPLLFIAMVIVMLIKLRKSPFDISSSGHAHQEIVSGVHTDYSGPQLALLEIGHWLEVVLLLGITALFWTSQTTTFIGVILIIVETYFVEILIDNISARMTWKWMLRTSLCTGMVLALVNIFWLYY
ncbi:MAG: NADH-quinone oxidoreductase subunit H [Desulfovibrionaceae bacterium]|nr:NADH-quinone oxidoreductase subunit H [Desulfovibrionaceae bacterium]